MRETKPLAIYHHCRKIKHVLIIEDSEVLSGLLQDEIYKRFAIMCDIAPDEESAREIVRRKRYDLIIADIHLPDGSGTLIVELVRQHHRVIVMTGFEDELYRSRLATLAIVDYVIKSDAKTMVGYFTATLERLNDNRNTVVGVCDDSRLARTQIKNLLELQNLPYVEFEDGQEVLDYMANPDTKLHILLTDYEMPRINGLELTRALRHHYSEESLPIISLSASGKPHLLAQFLKSGASDYLPKPYSNEEFLTRLNLTLSHLYMTKKYHKLIRELEELSVRDYLTKLYNRHFFFLQIPHVSAEALRRELPFGILMIDIDFFKKVNDTHGHHAGDVAIAHIASLLRLASRESDYCFRWGGEEFLVLVPTTSQDEMERFGERIRSLVQNTPVRVLDEGVEFGVTVSIGGALAVCRDVHRLIARADSMLYEIKAQGRNGVKIAPVLL